MERASREALHSLFAAPPHGHLVAASMMPLLWLKPSRTQRRVPGGASEASWPTNRHRGGGVECPKFWDAPLPLFSLLLRAPPRILRVSALKTRVQPHKLSTKRRRPSPTKIRVNLRKSVYNFQHEAHHRPPHRSPRRPSAADCGVPQPPRACARAATAVARGHALRLSAQSQPPIPPQRLALQPPTHPPPNPLPNSPSPSAPP